MPDEQFALSLIAQNFLVYFVAIIMAMYLPFYFYKVFHLEKLRFYAYWGSIWFLFLPFILLFVTPYFITGNLELSIKLLTIAPFFYSISFFYALVRVIREKHRGNKDGRYKEEIIGAVAIWFWILLPIRAFFRREIELFLTPYFNFEHRGTTLIIILTNVGLLLLTILFVRQNIRQSKSEYLKLLESEKKLLEINADLIESERKLQVMNSELLDKVKERTQELEKVNDQRVNTFINLAHDIKTPLTLINNYLEDYTRETEPTESLRVIKLNIEKLTKNIVNFFDAERIKKGVTIYDHDQISNLSAILEENVILFRSYAAKKKISISIDIKEHIFVKAAPESINRVINNVIENAVKYSDEEGQVSISLQSTNGRISLSVKDTGIGIAPELHEKIFDPYYQINSKKANFQGMGLGLAITKRIVDGLYGEIQIISNPIAQRGTLIIISLTQYNVAEDESISNLSIIPNTYEEVHHLTAKDEIHDENLLTLFIVEDNIELLNYMVRKLKNRYNIHIAISGNEAIEKLKLIKHLDLIISDVMMDNGTGFDLRKHISTQKKFKHIPFIFLTAKTEDRIQGLALGAIDYILKPFLIDELVCKIESVLSNLSEQRRAIIDTIHQSIVSKNDHVQPTHLSKNQYELNCIKYNLTSQERKIIPLIAEGKTNKEIAEALFISDKTVKKHLQNIFEKVNATGKLDLLNKLEISIMDTKD